MRSKGFWVQREGDSDGLLAEMMSVNGVAGDKKRASIAGPTLKKLEFKNQECLLIRLIKTDVESPCQILMKPYWLLL